MEYGALLTDSKWNIIKELSKKEQTPTDLAEKTNTSLANISQQLRLLEAYGLVKKERKINTKEPGKPRTVFSLGKEVMHTIIVSNYFAEKKDLELDYLQKAIFTLWMMERKEDIYYLEKFLITNEELIKKCDAIGLVKSDNEKIELLLVTEHIQDIRDKYSNQTVQNLEDKKKTIVCWTHNIKEIEDGIKGNNDHFIHLVKNLKSVLEKDNLIKKILDMKNEKNT